MCFANDIVLVGHLRELTKGKLEVSTQALEAHNYRLRRNKAVYICMFSKCQTYTYMSKHNIVGDV